MPIAVSLDAPLVALTQAATAVTPAATAATTQAPAGSFVGELLSILLPLAFIVLLLFGILRLARRRYGSTGADAALSVVQVVPLGPRERMVLVKTRSGRLFVVGVSAQTVNLVTDIDPADLLPTDTPGTGEIADQALSAPASSPVARIAKVLGSPLTRRDTPGRDIPRGEASGAAGEGE